jgi:hypothetical protein
VGRKKTKPRDRNRNPGWSVQVVGKKPKRRMSDTLIEFARPELLRDGDSAAEWRYELMLASIVWNGVLVGKTAAELLASLSEDGPLDPELAAIIETLVQRRATKYAADKRCVVDLQAYDTDEGIHVIAASAM